MKTLKDIKERLSQYKDQIQKNYWVRIVEIFGSYQFSASVTQFAASSIHSLENEGKENEH